MAACRPRCAARYDAASHWVAGAVRFLIKKVDAIETTLLVDVVHKMESMKKLEAKMDSTTNMSKEKFHN